MPALNFKKEFAPLVESGKKRQTIRQVRKRPIIPGDRLFLYTGMRTDKCRKLRESTCELTVPIVIEDDRIIYNSMQLSPESASDFAKKDGFSSTDDFINFFRQQYGLPFMGVLIQW